MGLRAPVPGVTLLQTCWGSEQRQSWKPGLEPSLALNRVASEQWPTIARFRASVI